MRQEYNLTYIDVNNFTCFTKNNSACNLGYMNFGERLKKARQYAELSQQALADALGRDANDKPVMSQANISGLETDPKAEGSVYTCQLAMICGVRPQWLAMEEGLMVDNYKYKPNSVPGKLYQVAEKLPKEQQAMLLKFSNSLTEPDGEDADPPASAVQ